MDRGPHVKKGNTRDIVGEASGFGSGRTYARAKYVHENKDIRFSSAEPQRKI